MKESVKSSQVSAEEMACDSHLDQPSHWRQGLWIPNVIPPMYPSASPVAPLPAAIG